MKFFSLIVHANLFTKIDDRNFNKIFLSIIEKKFKKVAELILKSKDDVNFSAYKSLFHKQKTKSNSM